MDSEFAEVIDSVERLDKYLITLFERRATRPDAEEARRLLARVLSEAKQIQVLIDTLFEHLVNLESGRDSRMRAAAISFSVMAARNS